MKRATCIFILFLSLTRLVAQNSTSIYWNDPEFNSSDQRNLFFRIENQNFLKNNEYTGDIVTGYTLIGAWMRPKLLYYPSENLRLEVGGHFLKYNGRDEFEHCSFWYQAHYKPSEIFSVLLGNLNNNANHYLIRPLFEPEQYFTEKPEEGIQFLFNNSWLNSDLWLNWEQFILPKDPFQEHFTVGWSTEFQLLSSAFTRIGMPVQLLITHKGGQIDTSDDPVQTLCNKALGISFTRDLTSPVIKQWSMASWYATFKDVSGTKKLGYDKGNGILLEAYVDTRFGKLTGSYWNANKFIATKGMDLYQVISSKIEGRSVKNREIVSLNYDYTKQVAEGANFGVSMESYYDFKVEKLSYVWGFFLSFNESFFLKVL